jgi:hypothetical protein
MVKEKRVQTGGGKSGKPDSKIHINAAYQNSK